MWCRATVINWRPVAPPPGDSWNGQMDVGLSRLYSNFRGDEAVGRDEWMRGALRVNMDLSLQGRFE